MSLIMACGLLLAGCGLGEISAQNVSGGWVRFDGSVDYTVLETFIHNSLENLQELGIDVTEAQEDITDQFLSMPEEILRGMDANMEWTVGMLLSWIESGHFPGTEQAAGEIYSFDLEVPDIQQMYTSFLEGVVRISGGELEVTDIEEEISDEVLERGTGTEIVRFCCNGKDYTYKAKYQHDWFDTGMLTFMNKVLKEQDTGSYLYVTSDGFQECIVFYCTQEWAEQFHSLLGVKLERP